MDLDALYQEIILDHYTTPAEIDALVEGLHHTRSYFKVDE